MSITTSGKLLLCFAWAFVVEFITSVRDINKLAEPIISWSNINFGSPVIKIFFGSQIDFDGELNDFWVKLSLPFYANTIKPQWAIDNCSPNQVFNPASEERISLTNEYTEFRIQLLGAKFQKTTMFILRIIPDPYMDFLGYSNPVKIAIISANSDNHLVYAYNDALFHFLGTPSPSNDLIVKSIFKDTDCYTISRNCSQVVKVRFTDAESIYRIVIELTGDYLFEDFDPNSCWLQLGSSMNATQIPKNYYSCSLSENFGDNNRYLVFESSIVLKPDSYYLRFVSTTPSVIGTQSFRIFAMDQYSSTIISYAEIPNQFQAQPLQWQSDYPQLKFSMGFNASDSSLPSYLGLYSTSSSYNQVLNTLKFYVQAKELPVLRANDTVSVKVYLGLPNPIFPLGQVRDNFQAAPNTEKTYQRIDDQLIIGNVLLDINTTYTITFKIGFTNAVDLNPSSDTGFGVIQILQNGNIVVSGKTILKFGFTKVLDNKNLFLPESVSTASAGYYRGFSAFRSAPSTQLLNTAANYKLQPTNHGLRIGDSQEFFFQSSLGSISLYTPSVSLSPLHNSARSFLQVVTHPSIRSKATSFPDSSAQSNCKFYSCIFSKWSNQFTITEAQTVLDPTLNNVITVQPPSYNPISGCSYTKVDYSPNEKLSYSRFRMRFQDLMCQNQVGDAYQITGVKFAFTYSISQLVNAAQRNGNYYVFNNIDVVDARGSNEFNSDFYVLDAFVHLYYFSNIFQTDQTVTSLPNILMMDNMYILNDATTSFVSAANLKMFIQNQYYTVSAGTRTVNDNSRFPAIVQIYGKFDNMDPNTSQIKIFFEVLEPLPVSDASTTVDCKSQGLKVKNCTLEYGLSEIQQISYTTYNLQSGQHFYLNFKYTTALVINVDPTSIVDANSLFVFAFPVQLINTPLIESFLLTSANTMGAYPAFQFNDGNLQIIQKLDFGSIGASFSLNAYSPSYVIASVPALSAAQINTIYDTTNGNEPATYFQITYSNNKSGKYGNLQYLVKGAGFKKLSSNLLDFHSTTFCSDFNFINTTLTATGSTGTLYYSQCQSFTYLNRHCLYCPEIASPSTTFALSNIVVPNSNGLLWPANTISLLSNKIPVLLMDHSLESNIFNPNVLALPNSQAVVPLSGLSFNFTFQIQLSNPLAKNQYIILNRVVGSFRFVLKGDNSRPFCSISQREEQTSCFFQITVQSILIQVYSPLTANDFITVSLFGVSTQGALPYTNMTAEIFSAIDTSLSQRSKIDSSLPNTLAVNYNETSAPTSLLLNGVSLSSNINNALLDFSVNISLVGRKIFPNDAIYVDFGFPCLTENSHILLTNTASDFIVVGLPSVEVVSPQEILIGDISNFSQNSFKLKIWAFNMTFDNDISLNALYTFNYGFLAFKSPPVNYPTVSDLPNSKGSAKIMFSGTGFKSGILFSVQPYYTVRETDIIYLRFDSASRPSLSNFPLYAFENNFGNNELNIWLESPYIVGINGFQNEFDANRTFTFWIYGLQQSSDESTVLMTIAKETGLTDPKEKALIKIAPSIETQYISEVVIHKLLFSPRYLRTTGSIGFRLDFQTPLSRSQSLILNLDHLNLELLKPISPKCELYRISKAKFFNYTQNLTMNVTESKASNANFTANLSLIDDIFERAYAINYCKLLGNSLEVNLGEDVGVDAILVVSGLPTPDQNACRLIQPSLIVTNAKNTKVLMSSSAITSNAQRATFENYKQKTTLGYVNLANSQIEIVRGFYEIVSIAIDFSPQSINTFKKRLTFVLINNEDGRFYSQNFNPRTGKTSKSQSGDQFVDLVIGAEEQTSVFVYPLIIMKQEYSPILYSDPPILNAKVVSRVVNLIYPAHVVYVYRGGYSLPIIITSPKLLINELYFSLKVTGEAASDIKLQDDTDEFLLSFSTSSAFLTLQGLSNTNWVEATLQITPVDSTLFAPAQIRLMLVHEEAKANNFGFNISLIEPTGAMAKFDSQNQVYVAFYVAPSSFNRTLPQTYIETMIKSGAVSRNGVFFYVGILTDVTNSLLIYMGSLFPNSQYLVQGYYTIASQNIKGNFTQGFTSRSL